ncbi:MAG: peptidylprolyl isomerase, partial [Bacteroidia bacterium]
KLIKEGWFEDSPFHRVINHFMIQGGGNKDGRPDPGYKVPAEFLPHKYVHLKGQLAAARQGDNVNPQKASSGSQFYIVQGKKQNKQALQMMEQRINQSIIRPLIEDFMFQPQNAAYYKRKAEGKQWTEFHYTPEQIAAYEKIGGTPHLDGTYTVFGRITKGLEVIDKIAAVKTGAANKPVNDVKMKIKLK